jgi:hypothetical protein
VTVIEVYPSGGDDTDALQAAVTIAESYGDGTTGTATVHVNPGSYRLSDTIVWADCSIVADEPNVGVRIYWDGPAVPAFRKTAQFSFGSMSGLAFRPGDSEPSSWLDLTDGSVDALFQLSRIHFGGSTVAAIDMGGWVNAHWHHLRFDNVGGYAIRATPPKTQNLSSFVLDGFTYDHHRGDHLGQGVVKVDNTAGASNLGMFTLRGGRIETNSAWTGTKAILTITHAPAAQARACGFRLDDVTYQDIANMSDDALICRDTVNTSGNETVIVDASRFATIARFNNGPWWSGALLPAASVLNAGVAHLAIGQGTNIW